MRTNTQQIIEAATQVSIYETQLRNRIDLRDKHRKVYDVAQIRVEETENNLESALIELARVV